MSSVVDEVVGSGVVVDEVVVPPPPPGSRVVDEVVGSSVVDDEVVGSSVVEEVVEEVVELVVVPSQGSQGDPREQGETQHSTRPVTGFVTG